MRNLTSILALTLAMSAPALAAPQTILDANKAASGGQAWDNKEAETIDYAYSGQGLTGKVTSRADLAHGYWTDDVAIGPVTQANGFDGAHAWMKDASGTVTQQDGGEQRQLAVNEGYRRANMWWRADRGGAAIVEQGTKSEGGQTFDVLAVTPKEGTEFDAWFDAKTHLVARIVEKQGPQTVTTTLADYAPTDGVALPHKIHISTGEAKYDQDMTVTKASFGPSPGQASFGAPKVSVADFSITHGGKQTSFPFRLLNNHIYADVGVNGRGPFQFIFDTGGENLLTPTLAKQLGIKSEGQMQGGGAGSGHMDVGLAKVDSITLADATLKGQVFAVAPLDMLAPIEGTAMPGMVGFETFRRFVTRIDYGTRTMTLILPEAFDPKDAGVAIPFTFNGNLIEAPATYNGIKGTFTIDSGSRSSITLNKPFVAQHGLNKDNKTIDAVTGWGVGGATRALATRGDTLTLGTLSVRGPVVELSTDKGGAFTDASFAGNIGAGILKRFVVTLDYEHRVMYLKPIAGPVPDLDTFDRAGLWFNVGKTGFDVVDITKGAPADQAGLKTGDIIVGVDGKPASDLKVYEVRQRLRDEAPGSVVKFAVKRGSETKDVAVTLRDLI